MLWLAILLASTPVPAQSPAKPSAGDKTEAKEKDNGKKTSEVLTSSDETPVVTHYEATIGGKAIKYTATASLTPIRSKGETEARIFSIAYTRDEVGDLSERPLMFSFNGGPGSASVWLHLGSLGPKRVAMPETPTVPSPPFRLVENDASWLDRTDLVFIDPVGTGYSRAVKPELNKKFHGVKGDIESIAEFIRMYLTRNGRWTSPLYLVGESYGTTRAAGLSDHLIGEGIALNGIVLISSALDFATLINDRSNDLPFVLFLPSFTATAWYHKKLPNDLQAGLHKTLAEAEHWAETEYLTALGRGDRLSAEERQGTAEQLARYTGLSTSLVARADLRITPEVFRKELLRAENRTVGRFDGRYQGIDAQAARPSPEYDPSLDATRPIFASTFNQYVREDLQYKTDLPYHILGGEVGSWDWGPSGRGHTETFGALRDAMTKNPHMKLLIASGLYDLATPYRALEHTLAHMRLAPALRSNVRVETFPAGHMMYLHPPSLDALKQDLGRFLDESKSGLEPPGHQNQEPPGP